MSKTERNQLILNKIKEATELGLQSKDAARRILISEGIYTPKGNLKKEFGGRGATKRSAKRAA
ncbi:hypothetical protein FGU71_00455 [Erythrobacter insulae]|uniref:Uncharacterized protein n=1 Tax=Erythrobacter insulae TaxID=2584124 RepID=A0A547P8N0_9SPHN|nr:hypothetical protein [Erythrobacter insulae]TRD10489.1 hypothetical protein FGU71_00455 [Erythrobacter insulae]